MYRVRSLLQTITTEFAVLDLHFSAHERNLFAIGTSTGSICLYVLESDHENEISMRRLSCLQVADHSVLVLSLAWSPSSCTPTTLAYSLSSGHIGIFDYKSFRSSSRTSEAHSSEAWTIAWSAMKSIAAPTLYSGGDDSALCKYLEAIPSELNQNPGQPMSQSIIRDETTHGAGVTAILPIAIGVESEEIVLTGSYDEFIRVLTLRAPSRRAQVLCEKGLGGGVWRLKCLGYDRPAPNGKLKIEVLASCMHAGTRVVQICRSEECLWAITIVARFEEHESMNYASDARREVSEEDSSSTTYASTSFYDKKLCIWNLKDGKTK